MVKDISDIIWGFIAGAFVLSVTLLIGVIKYLLNEKSEKMEKLEENVDKILLNTSVIPTMQQEIKENTSDIRKLQLEVVSLKRDAPKDHTS